MAVLTRRKVDHGIWAMLRFLSKIEFLLFFQSRSERSKEGFDPHSERLEILERQGDE